MELPRSATKEERDSLSRVLEGAEAITIQGVEKFDFLTDTDLFFDLQLAYKAEGTADGFELTRSDHYVRDMALAYRNLVDILLNLSSLNPKMVVFSQKARTR